MLWPRSREELSLAWWAEGGRARDEGREEWVLGLMWDQSEVVE